MVVTYWYLDKYKALSTWRILFLNMLTDYKDKSCLYIRQISLNSRLINKIKVYVHFTSRTFKGLFQPLHLLKIFMHMSVCMPPVQVPIKHSKTSDALQSSNYRGVVGPMWVLELQVGSYEKAASVHNCLVISLVPFYLKFGG